MTPDDFDMGDEPTAVPSAAPLQVSRLNAGAGVPADVVGQGADLEPTRTSHETLRGTERQHDTGDRRPPLHDEPAEQHVLSCLLIDPTKATLPPEVFHFPAHRLLYLSILRLRAANSPVEAQSIAADLSDRGQFDQIGGWPFLFQIDDRSRVPTALHFQHYAIRITSLSERREAGAHAEETLRALELGQPLPKTRQEQNPERVAGPVPPSDIVAKPLFDFPLVLDGDSSVLLGNRYLNRGDGAVLVSTSGMGKSTAAIQGAAELALGLGPFGIQGNGPLSSLIVQSEDSEGDIAEVAYSLKHVLKLTPEQVTTVNAKVHIVTDRVNRGTRFIAALKKLIDAHKPDLVWINPLQAFMDGDVTDSRDLGAFLREGLNSLNQPPSFGYIVVHHTTKPATGKERSERLWHEVMYDMAGGAEIINWARAIISLRAAPTEGEFNMVLAKRGRRAGVTRKVPNGVGFLLEPVTSIPLKHATGRIEIPGIAKRLPLVYWEARQETAPEPTESHSGKGRPSKYLLKDYVNLFPAKSTAGLVLNELHRALLPNGEIPRKQLHAVCERWAETGEVEILDSEGQPRRYRKGF